MVNKKDVAKKSAKRERIVLLDTHAIIHRAYHALPEFSSSKGEPTGALYGLSSMLLKISETLKPDYIIATRDRAEKTHRHEVYEDYKGTRAKTDDALIQQIEKAHKVFEAFGIPLYDANGYEADDIIGTLVEKLSKKDCDIIIASGDYDMLQLVSGERVRVFTLRTGFNDTVLFDEGGVKEKYGFGPEFVTDYKGIVGDASDNIKGVPGVGEGSATKLIKAYGGIDEIYKVLNAKGAEAVAKEVGIQKRYAQLVLDNEDAAVFSKMLATIKRDAPIDFEKPVSVWKLADHVDAIGSFCDEFEFRSLKERVRTILHQNGAGTEGEAKKEAVTHDTDSQEFQEAAVALWLLRSDKTVPEYTDVVGFGGSTTLEEAREAIFSELNTTGRLREVYDTIEQPLVAIARRMKEHGILIDAEYLEGLRKEYSTELAKIATRIYGYVGREFNISSPKQLGGVLFDELKISLPRQKKTATGARTTKEEELLKMKDQHPIIADVLAYRELQKLLSTYIENIPELLGEDGRLHPTSLQTGTTTGRMASENPNIQNIPIRSDYGRRIRNAFIVPKGKSLVSIDYSQIELRIAAGLSGDKNLIEIFKTGGDVHTAVASQVFGVPPEHVDTELRRRAKVINFGILYGMGVNALRANLGDSVTRDDAANFLHQYFANFSGLARYIEGVKADAARNGYTETLFGRRRYFAGFQSSIPMVRAQAERMAINAPIQGTQADIIKLAMIQADAAIEQMGWEAKVHLLMQVHDELVFEIDDDVCDEAVQKIAGIMEGIVSGDMLSGVPIRVEASVGKNWGETKRVQLHR